jgi:hypothetical protein
LKVPTQEGTAGSRKVGRQVRTLLAGWLAGWLAGSHCAFLPAARAFSSNRKGERECVCFFSGERRRSHFANPQTLASLLCAIAFSFFLPLVLVILSCFAAAAAVSLSRVTRALQYFPSSLFVFCCVSFVFVCVCERARDSRNYWSF